MAVNEIEIQVTGLGGQGDGLAEGDAGRLYIPFTVPGDVARVALKAKKGEGQAARLVEIVHPSKDRVESACAHFGTCGGCALQHLSDPAYAAFKRARVSEALARRGLEDVTACGPVIIPPGTRRRTRFTAKMGKHGVILGYSRRATHRLDDIYECPVITPGLEALLALLRGMLAPVLASHGPMQISATETGTGIDLVFEAKDEPSLSTRRGLAEFAAETDIARLSWSVDGVPETIVQRRLPMVSFGEHDVALPPGVFLQASRDAEEWMAQFALRHIQDGPVVDLFAGLGTFAFRLAGKVAVTAFETDPDMVDAIRQGVRSNGLHTLQAERRDLFRDPLTALELASYGGVVIDPPRAGAKAQTEALAESQVSVIVAFSCNPGTFARDARILVDGGYQLEQVVPIDQFRWSAHVELAAVFRRT